jgi:hypothetical protein
VTVLNYLGSTARHAEASRAVARTGFWLSLFRFQGATRHSPRQGVGAGFPRLVARPGDRHGTRSDLGCQCGQSQRFRPDPMDLSGFPAPAEQGRADGVSGPVPGAGTRCSVRVLRGSTRTGVSEPRPRTAPVRLMSAIRTGEGRGRRTGNSASSRRDAGAVAPGRRSVPGPGNVRPRPVRRTISEALAGQSLDQL